MIEAYSNIKSKEDHDSESMDLEIMRNNIKDSIMVALSAENNDINLSVIEDKFSIEHELSYVDLLRSTTKGASFARKKGVYRALPPNNKVSEPMVPRLKQILQSTC